VAEEEKFEDEIVCGSCKQEWLVETDKPGFVKNLSMLTGYMCSDCAGTDPQDGLFPARKKQ